MAAALLDNYPFNKYSDVCTMYMRGRVCGSGVRRVVTQPDSVILHPGHQEPGPGPGERGRLAAGAAGQLGDALDSRGQHNTAQSGGQTGRRRDAGAASLNMARCTVVCVAE